MDIRLSRDSSGPYIRLDPEGYSGIYTVIRNTDREPEDMFDGELIREGAIGVIEDRGILGGRNYYYAVEFDDRPGEFKVYGPFRTLSPIEGALATSSDNSIVLTFIAPEALKKTLIYKSSGEGFELFREVKESGQISLEDRDVESGVTYQYKFVALYEEGESEGLVISHKMKVYAEAPMIFCSSRDGNRFVIESFGTDDYELYYSKERLKLNNKRALANDVSKILRGLSSRRLGGGSCEVTLNNGMMGFIYPVVKADEFWIIGEPVPISTYADGSIGSKFGTDGCTLRFTKMPNDCVGVKVLIDSNQMPQSPNAECDISSQFTDSEKLKNRRYCLEFPVKASMYYVKIYTVYKDEKGEDVYSNGVGLEKPTPKPVIRYRFNSGIRTSSIAFECDTDIAMIPPMVLIVANRGVPIDRSGGEEIAQIGPVSMSRRRGSCDVPLRRDRFDNALLFFKDPSDESRYSLFKS